MEQSLEAELSRYRSLTFAASTQSAYKCHRDSYLKFCSAMGYCAVPASSATLCRYAAMLARTHSYTSIKQYLNIIRLLHRQWDLPNPLENNFALTCVLSGIRRALGDSVNRKAPITPHMLLGILGTLDLTLPLHCNVWAAALVMFYAMLRRSNVLPNNKSSFNAAKHLRRQDVTLQSDCVVIKIRWTKTIQFQQRNLTIPLPRLFNNPLCPLQATFKAFSETLAAEPSGPAFVTTSSKNSPPLTIDTFLSIIRTSLQSLGLDSKNFSGHSFRRGGATWAYQCGLPVDTIRQIGDWKSNAYTKYIFDSPDSIKRAMTIMASQLPTT